MDRAGPEQRPEALSTLGAVLYRAGRFGEALRHLEEAVAADAGRDAVPDWLFLAMIHARLGRPAEGRRLLDQADGRIAAGQAPTLGIEGGAGPRWADAFEPYLARLLRLEAEGVVLDAGFPTDPFAP